MEVHVIAVVLLLLFRADWISFWVFVIAEKQDAVVRLNLKRRLKQGFLDRVCIVRVRSFSIRLLCGDSHLQVGIKMDFNELIVVLQTFVFLNT